MAWLYYLYWLLNNSQFGFSVLALFFASFQNTANTAKLFCQNFCSQYSQNGSQPKSQKSQYRKDSQYSQCIFCPPLASVNHNNLLTINKRWISGRAGKRPFGTVGLEMIDGGQFCYHNRVVKSSVLLWIQVPTFTPIFQFSNNEGLRKNISFLNS